MQTVNPKEFDDTNTIPPHVLQKLRELGIFGAMIHPDYKGMGLLQSEFLRVLETVGKVPALGLFLQKQGIPPIDLLQKYGTVAQKWKYLPKIASGQSLATIAITEMDSGPSAKRLDTVGVLSDCDNYWLLDGEKTFVANASQSDVFLVIGHAMLSGVIEKRPETVATFIIEKDTPGVSVSRQSIETAGLKGFTTHRLIMKNVKIPKENMLGEIGNGTQHMIDLFTESRHVNATLCIDILKSLQDALVKDVLHRKHFDKRLHETYTATNVFSNLTTSIYAMESMLYLTSSMIDIYDGQDVQMETALTEMFCVQTCLKRIQESLWLVGPRACTLVQPFEQMLRDSFTLTHYETSLFDTKIFAALLGLQHYGLTMGEKIKKTRNPLMFPKYAMLQFFEPVRHLKLHLEEYVHPSLKECADFCDRCLFKLKESAENMLIRNGTNVGDYHVDLQRLSDMAAIIYAYIAVLGRASRSYCIGNRDADSEVKIAMMLAYRMQQEVFAIAEDIKVSEFSNGDFLGKEISELTFERKEYIAAHPLQRNY